MLVRVGSNTAAGWSGHNLSAIATSVSSIRSRRRLVAVPLDGTDDVALGYVHGVAPWDIRTGAFGTMGVSGDGVGGRQVRGSGPRLSSTAKGGQPVVCPPTPSRVTMRSAEVAPRGSDFLQAIISTGFTSFMWARCPSRTVETQNVPTRFPGCRPIFVQGQRRDRPASPTIRRFS